MDLCNMFNTIKMITENQLKPGDEFVRFSKYGHVFGIVESIFSIQAIDLDKKIVYAKMQVRSTNSIAYDYSECYKIITHYNDEQVQNLRKLYGKLAELKSNH